MNGRTTTGTNLDTVRRHNLATVLGIVHRGGPVARSSLTHITGLNRSTVGALVAELVELGLVSEREPEPGHRVGRPSPVVAADGHVVAIAVHPEVDAVTVGVVGLDSTVHRRVRAPTGHVPTAGEAAAIAAAMIDGLLPDLSQASRVVGVGVAVPGLVREGDGVVRLAPHLEWAEEPFAAVLAAVTGFPVLAANDARLGANAERLFGAGRGANDLVYINGGASGIGAGAIVGGTPLTGLGGYAGELGHTLVNSSGGRCHCGAVGCLETEVSQAALLRVLGLESAGPDELDAALSAAVGAGETAVVDEVDRQLGFLAVALRNAANVFDPERIVLGGFLGSLHELVPERLPALVAAQALAASVENLTITRAALGSDILLIGAAELAFGPLLAAPASPGAVSAHPRPVHRPFAEDAENPP